MVRPLVDETIEPLALAIIRHRHLQRSIGTAHSPVYLDDVLLRHPEFEGNPFHRFGRKISLFETFQLTLHRAQVEEELLLQRVLPEVPGALAGRRRLRAVGSDLAEDLLNQPAILHQNLINIHSHDSRPG